MEVLTLKVLRILATTRDTATIVLERADGLTLDYTAGQFLTLLLSFHGRELRRSYSFSSTPGVDVFPSITVKRVVNGEASRYLLDHLRVGDELMALPPAGRFVLEREIAGGPAVVAGPATLFFIAAGSGMAPVYSLLKAALQVDDIPGSRSVNGPETRIVLFTQHHDEESILFKPALEALTEKYSRRFRWVNFLSDTNGRLNNWLLEVLVRREMERDGRIGGGDDRESDGDDQEGRSHSRGDLAGRLFYLCGPPAFMRMAQFTLRLMGFADAQIKKENFTVEYVPPPPLLTDMAPKEITIHSGSNTWRFSVAWPETILQAGLHRHIALPYSCRGGRCSTCVARCLKGKVRMSINEVLTEKDLREGLVLTCVGYAETDVELEF